jgi:hypothetical protein
MNERTVVLTILHFEKTVSLLPREEEGQCTRTKTKIIASLVQENKK